MFACSTLRGFSPGTQMTKALFSFLASFDKSKLLTVGLLGLWSIFPFLKNLEFDPPVVLFLMFTWHYVWYICDMSRSSNYCYKGSQSSQRKWNSLFLGSIIKFKLHLFLSRYKSWTCFLFQSDHSVELVQLVISFSSPAFSTTKKKHNLL